MPDDFASQGTVLDELPDFAGEGVALNAPAFEPLHTPEPGWSPVGEVTQLTPEQLQSTAIAAQRLDPRFAPPRAPEPTIGRLIGQGMEWVNRNVRAPEEPAPAPLNPIVVPPREPETEEARSRRILKERIRAADYPRLVGTEKSAEKLLTALATPAGALGIAATPLAPGVMLPVWATLGTEGSLDAIQRIQRARETGDRAAEVEARADLVANAPMVAGPLLPRSRAAAAEVLASPRALRPARVQPGERAGIPVPSEGEPQTLPVAPQPEPTGDPNALSQPETTPVLRDVPVEPGVSEQALPAQEGAGGVPPSVEGETPTGGTEVPLTPAGEAPPGPGAASPSEFAPEKPFVTGAANAVTAAKRETLALPKAREEAARKWGTVWDDVQREVAEDPAVASRLVTELNTRPRPISDREVALLDHEMVSLEEQKNRVVRLMLDAAETGGDTAIPEHRAHLELLRNQLQAVYDASKVAGREQARGFNIRKALVNEQYTLTRMEMEKRAENDGAPLSEAQLAEVKALHDKIAAAEKAHADYVLAADEKLRKSEEARVIAELKAAAAREAREDAATGTTRDLDAERANITAGIVQRAPNTPLRDLRPWIRKLALNFVRGGISERDALANAVHGVLKDIMPGVTLRDTMDAISGYGDFRPLDPEAAKATLRDLSGQMQSVAKLEDLLARRALRKTGPERKTPSNEERRLTKLVNEYKKRYGVVVTDPAAQLKSALDAVKTRLTNQIADLEFQIRTGQKIVKGATKVAYDEAARKLVERRDALKKEFDDLFGRPELTDEQRIAQAERALQVAIADYEARIKASDVAPRKRESKTPQTQNLQVLRDRRDALRGELEYLREILNPKRTPEQRATAVLKTRLRNQISDLRERLAKGDFADRPRKDVTLDPEALALQHQADLAKAEFQTALDKDRFSKLSTPRKVLHYGGELYDTARVMLTSFDLSAPLRQGKFILAGRPVLAAKSFPAMFKALASRDAAYAIDKQILARPNYPLYKQSGLYLSEHGAPLARLEEAYMSRLAERIPGVAATQRAYNTFLNKLRADTFDALAESLSSRRPVTPLEGEVLANYVNAATGRGSMGGLEQAAVGLNRVFFSPRYVASRFQLILGQPLYRGTARTRALIASEYARVLIGYGVMYGLYRLALPDAEVETDPRSSDAGKIVIGNTRVDPLAGLQQNTVLLSRLASGETMDLAGRVSPIRGDAVRYGKTTAADVLARYVRSKLAPVPGAVVNAVVGKDLSGQEVTPASTLQSLTVPLAYQDILKAIEDQGVPRGTALGLLSVFGEGLQVYDEGR